LPPSCTNTYLGDTPYFDCGGAYYAQVSNGYEVVTPPIGATVAALPNGAVSKTINGVNYFTFAGTYYQPFYSGSDVIYKIVQDPTSS
jgi:hypothetical protein